MDKVLVHGCGNWHHDTKSPSQDDSSRKMSQNQLGAARLGSTREREIQRQRQRQTERQRDVTRERERKKESRQVHSRAAAPTLQRPPRSQPPHAACLAPPAAPVTPRPLSLPPVGASPVSTWLRDLCALSQGTTKKNWRGTWSLRHLAKRQTISRMLYK